MFVIQDAGNLGGNLWAVLAPIAVGAVAAGVTYVVNQANALKGKLTGYAAQVAVVVIPVFIGYAQAKTGWDLSSAAMAASGFVGWIGTKLFPKAEAK